MAVDSRNPPGMEIGNARAGALIFRTTFAGESIMLATSVQLCTEPYFTIKELKISQAVMKQVSVFSARMLVVLE